MSSSGTAQRQCHICGTMVTEWCPICVAAFPHRRPVSTMTGEERAQELEVLRGPLEIPFDLVHQRIEELVGRPVWTHEMGSAGWPKLIEAARSGNPGAMTLPDRAIVAILPDDKETPQ